MSEVLSARRIIVEAIRLGIASAKPLAAVWLLLVLIYAAGDISLTGMDLARVQGVLGLVALYLQLLITGVALSHAHLAGYAFDRRSPTRGRFAAAFGQSLIYILAVIAGLALLVVPGLILMVRWSVCLPALLAENLTITRSLRRSWNMTRSNWKALSIVVAVILAMWTVAIALMFVVYPDFGVPTISRALFVNAAIACAWVATWLLYAATYALLRRAEQS